MEYIELIRKFQCQVKEISSANNNIILPDFNKILFCGMGGSGIIGTISKDILPTEVPIFISKGYDIPDHIDEKTLVFCISYSGNTEETLSCFYKCLEKTKNIIIISSGGQLEQLAKQNNIQYMKVPAGIPPRAATGYLLTSVLKTLGVVIPFVDIDSLEQTGEKIASLVKTKTTIIYTSSSLRSVGLRWQQQFNENCKKLCVLGYIPEMNHNQINAFIHINNNAHVILIQDNDDNTQNKKRFEFLKTQLQKQKTSFTVINISGSKSEKIIKGLLTGDFTSYFLSKILCKDPFDIEIIENLKKFLV
jgi:glucose/mannose-6-phosphate isomerase